MRFSKFAGNKPVCKSTDLKRKSAFLVWDTPYFILYSSLFLQKYPMFDEQVNYNLETPIRVLPDKYKTYLWEVLKLLGASTTFESEMYNICMKDVLLLLRAIIQLFSAFSRYPLLLRHLRMKLKGLNAKCQYFASKCTFWCSWSDTEQIYLYLCLINIWRIESKGTVGEVAGKGINFFKNGL